MEEGFSIKEGFDKACEMIGRQIVMEELRESRALEQAAQEQALTVVPPDASVETGH